LTVKGLRSNIEHDLPRSNEKDELLDVDKKMISAVELATMLKLTDGCDYLWFKVDYMIPGSDSGW
jgi:hypothetical protein